MSKKINTTAIGLFIVTGVTLGLMGLLLFSSWQLFAKKHECIAYFDDSLNGLNKGAPVKYRGVTIGSVERVMVRFNQAVGDYAMPVILELDEKLLRERMAEAMQLFTEQAWEVRIKRGLRATLQSESLLTGVLYVEIHIHPDAPPPMFHQLKKIYPELPTEPTQIQQLMSNLSSLDIKSIQKNLNGLLTKLDRMLGNLQMAQINQGITNLLTSLDRLVSSPEITNDLVAVGTTLDQYRALGEKLTGRIDPLVDSITNTLVDASRALAQIRGAGENLRTLLAPDAALRTDLDQALQQLAGAAQSISALIEFLKQHPNALIAGRQTLEKKR
jgi:paraquat-inducible protein B